MAWCSVKAQGQLYLLCRYITIQHVDRRDIEIVYYHVHSYKNEKSEVIGKAWLVVSRYPCVHVCLASSF
jgi:hypothetical protein